MNNKKRASKAPMQLLREYRGESDALPEQEAVNYPPNSTFRIWHGVVKDYYETHWHTAVEIIMTEKSECACECMGTVYAVKAGEILIVPSDTPHSVNTPDGCHRYTIMLELESVMLLHDFFTLRSLMMFPIHITRGSQINKAARELLYQIIEEYNSGDTLREMRNYARILELYTLIGRHYIGKVQQHVGASRAMQQEYLGMLNAVMQYIDNHYQEPITLEVISAYVGFSKYHFTRLFKQYANTTFCQFLSLKRVIMAERLMATSALSITEIALQAGFGSIPTFNRVYKQVRQCTPTEFRALYSNPLPRRDWRNA